MFYFLRFSPGFSFNQNGLPPPPPPYTTIHLNFLNILTDKLHLFEVPALIPSEVHQNSHLVSAPSSSLRARDDDGDHLAPVTPS